MAGTIKKIAGPAYIANSATNIYTPPDAAVFTVINHIHIANITGGSVTFSLYVGATGGSAGGTQLFGTVAIAANETYDWYASPGLKLTSTDFLSGIASAATSLVITVMGSYQAT